VHWHSRMTEDDVLFDEAYDLQEVIWRWNFHTEIIKKNCIVFITWPLFIFICCRGSCSVIRRCTHRLTAQQFAVKIVDAAKFTAIPSLTLDSEFSFILDGIFVILIDLIFRSQAGSNDMPHAETPSHCWAAGNIQFRRNGLHGVWIVSWSSLYMFKIYIGCQYLFFLHLIQNGRSRLVYRSSQACHIRFRLQRSCR